MTPAARKSVFAGFAVVVLANLAILVKVLWAAWAGTTHPSPPPPSAAAERAFSTASHLFDPAENETHRRAAPYPAEFRKLDRLQRFDAVILRGPASLCVPLIRHFDQTRDFTLADLDHATVVFRRSSRPAEPSAVADATAAAAASLPPEQRLAVFLGLAERLLWLGAKDAAAARLDAAEQIAPSSPHLLTLRAALALERGNPAAAAEFAERATATSPSDTAAWRTKAQALLAAGKKSEALAAASRLLELQPDQPSVLYFHAHTAHAVGAYAREITSLEKLVALAESRDVPADGYRVHLAQAYAKRGDPDDGRKALALFERAAASGELDSAAAGQALEAAALIRERLGIPKP